MTQFRNATVQDLDHVLGWARDEGWNPGLQDAEAFFQADPEGFFVATDADGARVAAISVVNHSDAFAFLGLYIVRPDHRGHGIGLRLWQHALRHAGPRTVGLDGVEAQQQNYAASGFAHAGGTTRFTGRLAGTEAPDLRLAEPADLPALIAKEASGSGVAKPAYLSAWFRNTNTRRTWVMEGPGGVSGLCTVRRCHDGAKIGPLVANAPLLAARLVKHAAHWADGLVTLDVPETSTGLNALCLEHGLEPGFRTARMYRGPFTGPRHTHFAVTSLELG